MSEHDLHDQLERLGRRPVPPPRPEFVENLLARIQLTDDLSEPAPVIYLRRQSWARVRMAVAGVAAAVLLGAVGMLALARGGSEPGTSLPVEMASGNTSFAATVEDGRLVAPEDSPYEALQNGTHNATCRQGGRLYLADGGYVDCDTDDTLELEIVDGRIMRATKVGPMIVEQPSTETSTAVTQGEELELESSAQSGGVRLEWTPATGASVEKYIVVSALGEGAPPAPIDAPTGGPRDRAVSSTSLLVSLDELTPSTDKVAYRVFAVAADGSVLAESGTLTLTLAWEAVSTTR
ncbi:MAG: hypothetical protein GEV08_11735 [Acidimicrobiia bacterium]|nr:hypothetical protein [Acidimicrobiia bacterium]